MSEKRQSCGVKYYITIRMGNKPVHGIIAGPTKDISTAVVKQGMDIYTHRL